MSVIGKMENNNTSKNIIGCYLYDDLSISCCLNNDKHAIGLIFDVDKTDGSVWVMALKDSDCIGVHTPNELPKTDADFENLAMTDLNGLLRSADIGRNCLSMCVDAV